MFARSLVFALVATGFATALPSQPLASRDATTCDLDEIRPPGLICGASGNVWNNNVLIQYTPPGDLGQAMRDCIRDKDCTGTYCYAHVCTLYGYDKSQTWHPAGNTGIYVDRRCFGLKNLCPPSNGDFEQVTSTPHSSFPWTVRQGIFGTDALDAQVEQQYAKGFTGLPSGQKFLRDTMTGPDSHEIAQGFSIPNGTTAEVSFWYNFRSMTPGTVLGTYPTTYTITGEYCGISTTLATLAPAENDNIWRRLSFRTSATCPSSGHELAVRVSNDGKKGGNYAATFGFDYIRAELV